MDPSELAKHDRAHEAFDMVWEKLAHSLAPLVKSAASTMRAREDSNDQGSSAKERGVQPSQRAPGRGQMGGGSGSQHPRKIHGRQRQSGSSALGAHQGKQEKKKKKASDTEEAFAKETETKKVGTKGSAHKWR